MARRWPILALCCAAAVALAVAIAPAGAAPDPRAKPGASKPPATCFWEGPISTRRPSTRGFDGRLFNFPEESATYWMARFRLPEGAQLRLRGRYPHGRYMSLNTYTDGAPVDALSDPKVRPDAGSRNPFRTGAKREPKRRNWTVTVLPDAPPAEGERPANTLYGNQSATAAIELFYRVYEPDRGLDLTGGVGLPAAELLLADGSVVEQEAACPQINDADREIPVDDVPAAGWQAVRSTPPCDPETNPGYDPVRWERFFNVNYAIEAVATDCTEAGRAARLARQPASQGGFYSNRDSAYIYAHLAREFGPVLMVQARLPRTPQTYSAPKRMPRGDMRFWSLCTGESRVTTRTPDCLSDRQVLRQSGREFTVVVSKPEDRPANATRACGVAWLDWGANGDGAGDPDYAALILRNMLVDPDFPHAIQRVARPGTEAEVMGPYFPRADYMTREEFEARGC
jgi:hypothetical protein